MIGSRGLLAIKSIVNYLIQAFIRCSNAAGKIPAFRMCRKDMSSDCDTLIFPSALRHNIAQDSIVLDAYIVPLTKTRIPMLSKQIVSLFNARGMLDVDLNCPEEEVLWKLIFTALAEACRQGWQHRKNCAYITSGHIPVSTMHSESVICSCGEGKDVKSFPKVQGWQEFAKYSTRVAIMPLSAAPYVEEVVTREDMAKVSEAFVAHGYSNEPCSFCGENKKNLKKCARCGKVSYCNHACQKGDWKAYKKVCGK